MQYAAKGSILSRPSRARGLKQIKCASMGCALGVAPLAGAWIETLCKHKKDARFQVAPLAGAWIETVNLLPFLAYYDVAPLAGAWIETPDMDVIGISPELSRPSRARGLKRRSAAPYCRQ